MLRELFRRFTPAGRRALRKRRLEAILRENGLSKAAAHRIVAAYFVR
jgi:hypothetical protein